MKNIYFFFDFLFKCAGVGGQEHAPQITNFVLCACGCGPKSPHTKGLGIFLILLEFFYPAKGSYMKVSGYPGTSIIGSSK